MINNQRPIIQVMRDQKIKFKLSRQVSAQLNLEAKSESDRIMIKSGMLTRQRVTSRVYSIESKNSLSLTQNCDLAFLRRLETKKARTG